MHCTAWTRNLAGLFLHTALAEYANNEALYYKSFSRSSILGLLLSILSATTFPTFTMADKKSSQRIVVYYRHLLFLEIHQLLILGRRLLGDIEPASDFTVFECRLFAHFTSSTDNTSINLDTVLNDGMVHDNRVDNLDILSNGDMCPNRRLFDGRPLSDLRVIANQGIRTNLRLHLTC